MSTLRVPKPKPKPKRAGRPSGRFTQHRRIDKLQELLEKEPRGLTLDELATTLKITPRSVRRYLRELDATTDVESVGTKTGRANLWRIKPSERGRSVSLRRAQAYAILSVRRALDVLRGSALYDEVDNALRQIEKVAQTPFRGQARRDIAGDRQLEARFFWLPPTCKSYAARGEDLDELFRAVADLRVVQFRPRPRAEGAKAERAAFHPYAMVIHKGALVVIGARPGTRPEVLAFDDMLDVRASEDAHFELPVPFDVGDYIHGEFGVARPVRARFVVEFDALTAEDVRSRKLHPAQRVATSPDGRVRLSLPLVDVASVVSWVLSFGERARVIEPPELVRQVADEIGRAASRYS